MRRIFEICNPVVLSMQLAAFAGGLFVAQDFPLDDKRHQLGTEFYVLGRVEPIPEIHLPRKWGRLVDFGSPDPAGGPGSTFVFEDEEGTLRLVRTAINWTTYRIESASVFTIGRR